jgi:hypothetical protein
MKRAVANLQSPGFFRVLAGEASLQCRLHSAPLKNSRMSIYFIVEGCRQANNQAAREEAAVDEYHTAMNELKANV